jgi:hypothetical protein
MRERQKMQTFDWFIWVALAAMGIFLGLAIDGMFDLARTGSWRTIIVTLVLSGCWIVFYLLLERVFEFISTGRFSVPKQTQKRYKPLALLFGLPIGIIIGVIGAQFGLSDMLL